MSRDRLVFAPNEHNQTVGLRRGDKLEWSWEARDNEMIVIVRKADGEQKQNQREREHRINT